MKKPTLPIVAASASLTFVSCVNPSAQTGVNDFLKRNENSPVSVGRFGVTRKDGAPATTAAAPAEKPAPAPVTPAPAPQVTVKTAPAAEAPKEEKPKFSFWKKKETTPPAEAPAAPAQAPAPAEPEAPAEAAAKKEKPKTTVKFSFWNKKEAAAAPAENMAQQAPPVPAAPAAPAPQPQEEKPQGTSRFSFWKKNANSGEQKSTATRGSIGRFGYRAGQAAPPAAVAVQEAPPAPVKSTAKKSDKPKLEPAPFVEPLPEKSQSAGQKSGGPRLPNMLNLPEEKDLKTKGSAPKSGGDGVISKPPAEKKD